VVRAPQLAVAAASRSLQSTAGSLFSRLNLLTRFGLLSGPASTRILILGFLATHGRTLLSSLWSLLQQQFVSRLEVNEREEPWEWFQKLWNEHQVGKDSRSFAISPMKEGENELVAGGADVPLRTTLREDGATSFLFSPKTQEIFSTWSDLLRVPKSYTSPLGLPPRLQPLEIALLRLLPFTSQSTTYAWLNFGTTQMNMRPVSELYVNTFSLTRSRAPLEGIIRQARAEYMLDQVNYTGMFMPSPSRDGWDLAFRRPRRSKTSIVLEDAKKRALFEDAKAFFEPENQTWMAQRGLPFRRGYLLHGPPGNGKTSSVVALAGELKMDIYMLNLNDANMDESDLLRLTQQCATPCLLLLEDIDAIFTGRQRVGAGGAAPPPSSAADGKDQAVSGPSAAGTGENKTQLSFSSLLQVLDGAGSSEGRLLVLTTNHPERLDPALIRPGRVDVKIRFDNASKAQARELFVRIFSEYHREDDDDDGGQREGETERERARRREEERREEAIERARYGSSSSACSPTSSPNGSAQTMSKAELDDLAARFAALVPDSVGSENVFSMAQLQGFCIRQALRVDALGDLGSSARAALERFPKWRDAQLRKMSKGPRRRRDPRAKNATVGGAVAAAADGVEREGAKVEGEQVEEDDDVEDEMDEDDDAAVCEL
ncbi:hypothetical protein V8E36_002891, partial [Tilletia maclaganii]